MIDLKYLKKIFVASSYKISSKWPYSEFESVKDPPERHMECILGLLCTFGTL